jgi:hypothetical protein
MAGVEMMDNQPPETMFVNPLLAIGLEASLLERDLLKTFEVTIDFSPDDLADMRARLERIVNLARRAQGIELPLKVAVAAKSKLMPELREAREHKFPVIQGGKQ